MNNLLRVDVRFACNRKATSLVDELLEVVIKLKGNKYMNNHMKTCHKYWKAAYGTGKKGKAQLRIDEILARKGKGRKDN